MNALNTMLTPSAGLKWCEMLLCEVSLTLRGELRSTNIIPHIVFTDDIAVHIYSR
jgi:hypothetical protein